MSSDANGPHGEHPQLRSRTGFAKLLELWFGVSDRVGPAVYAASGFALILFKYAVEAVLIYHYTTSIFWPWDFLNPLLSARTAILRPAPEWLPWTLFLWTLPFLWIAVTMSVRRAADAGKSPWLGMLVLIPIVNLAFMLAMCFVPTQQGEHWSTARPAPSGEGHLRSGAFAVGISLIVGGVMLASSVNVFSSYGASLFVGTPMLMGATAAYLYNRPHPRGYGASMGIGLASVFFACLALLLFALEGLLCVAMAAPLMLPLGAMGGLIGKAIADATRRPAAELLAILLVLPLWAGGESRMISSPEYVVVTSVEIEAPAAAVWGHVVGFPELSESRAWYFSWGIACPERARIVGQGVGATRYCDFSTGTFVEPITAWEQPQRLAFDVTDQPEPLVELSPYRTVHPPHLDRYLRSTHGEFRLISLSTNRTRLEGRTWYRFDMFPQGYWTLWSDFLIHRIHERVLTHIKQLSEVAR
jgi:uncharacterized membrane protein YhaH (DUF805 family)